jgi:hypothetical protein
LPVPALPVMKMFRPVVSMTSRAQRNSGLISMVETGSETGACLGAGVEAWVGEWEDGVSPWAGDAAGRRERFFIGILRAGYIITNLKITSNSLS